MFKVNSRNTRKGCEIYSKLTIKTPVCSVFIVDFEQVNVSWDSGQEIMNVLKSFLLQLSPQFLETKGMAKSVHLVKPSFQFLLEYLL